VAGREVIGAFLSLEHEGAVSFAQSRRGQDESIEDRLKTEGRAADDLENVTRRPERFLDALQVGDVAADDQQTAVRKHMASELDVAAARSVTFVAIAIRIAHRGNALARHGFDIVDLVEIPPLGLEADDLAQRGADARQ